MVQVRTYGAWLLAAGGATGLLWLVGCSKVAAPPPAVRADYTQTLNKYYEGRPLCLWDQPVKFPVVNATPETVEDLGLDGLADAGLVATRGGRRGRATTYDLTPEGRSALNPDVFHPGAGNFCYGRRKVVSIDRAKRNSSTTELVDYQFEVADPAAWASEASIQNVFPQVVGELSGPHAAQVTLLDTTDGWEISGAPSSVAPRAPRSHGSTLARVLHLRKKSG
ncbi:MAG: hypothetical protein M3O02_09045 [Acidobacteriota bacterium]|nr:hypothetical protein [Acidobacteriota bacterium]